MKTTADASLDVASKVKEIIAEAMYLDCGKIKDDARLMSDLGAESIDFLDITFRLERQFSINFPAAETENFGRDGLSVTSVVRMVKNQLEV